MNELSQTHADLLERWRKSMNLVGPGPIAPHFEDCRKALAGLSPEGHWVDLGSGAGFPGLVLAADHPALRVDLVDSRRKRCTFLNEVLGRAGVPASRVAVHCTRVERLEGPYDGVVSRAFAPPPQVLEHGLRLLRPGGTLVLFLQEDAHPPDDPRYQMFHVEHYEVDGRSRKSVFLKRLE